MVIKLRLILISTGLSIVLTGCLSTKAQYKALTSQPASLNYLLENPKPIKKAAEYIFIEIDSSASSPLNTGYLLKERSYFLPILLYLKTYQRHFYSIGRHGLKDSPEYFLYTGFKREAKRNCIYKLTENKDSADYILSLHIDQLSANTLKIYQDQTIIMPFFYVTTYNYWLKEGEAMNTMRYNLYDSSGNTIHSGVKSFKEKIPDYPGMGIRYPLMLRLTSVNSLLAEGLSETFRHNFLAIIEDINSLEDL